MSRLARYPGDRCRCEDGPVSAAIFFMLFGPPAVALLMLFVSVLPKILGAFFPFLRGVF